MGGLVIYPKAKAYTQLSMEKVLIIEKKKKWY
jgi:hypothetical protein